MAWEREKNGGVAFENFYICNEPLVFITNEKAENSIYRASDWVKQNGIIPKCVFVDTYVDALGNGKENESESTAELFRVAHRALVKPYGCTVIFIHHNSRNGDMRGSTAIRGKLDHAFEIEQPTNERFVIKCTKNKHGEKHPPYRLSGKKVLFTLPNGKPDSNLVLLLDEIKLSPDGLNYEEQKTIQVLYQKYGIGQAVKKADLRDRLQEAGVNVASANFARFLSPLIRKNYIQMEKFTVTLLKTEAGNDFTV